MYVYVYIYIYVCVYIYMCIYIYMYIYIHICNGSRGIKVLNKKSFTLNVIYC